MWQVPFVSMHIIANPNHLIVSVSNCSSISRNPFFLRLWARTSARPRADAEKSICADSASFINTIRNDLADKLLLVHVTVIQAIQEGQLFVIFIAMRYRVVGQVDGIGYGTQRLQGCGDIVTVL